MLNKEKEMSTNPENQKSETQQSSVGTQQNSGEAQQSSTETRQSSKVKLSPSDLKKASEYFEIAARQGQNEEQNGGAKYKLGLMYAESKSSKENKAAQEKAKQEKAYETAIENYDLSTIKYMLENGIVHPFRMERVTKIKRKDGTEVPYTPIRLAVEKGNPSIFGTIIGKTASPAAGLFCDAGNMPTPSHPHAFVHYLDEICAQYKKGDPSDKYDLYKNWATKMLYLIVTVGTFPNRDYLLATFFDLAVMEPAVRATHIENAKEEMIANVTERSLPNIYKDKEELSKLFDLPYDDYAKLVPELLEIYGNEATKGICWKSVDEHLNRAAKNAGLDDKQKAEIRDIIARSVPEYHPSESLHKKHERTKAARAAAEDQKVGTEGVTVLGSQYQNAVNAVNGVNAVGDIETASNATNAVNTANSAVTLHTRGRNSNDA